MRIQTETAVGLFMLSALTVFLFMSFRIGIWRVDTVRYAHYIAYFSDVSGLNEKSDILIAGVKVGWVQKLSLVSRTRQVRVDMMIERNSIIYQNASAVIKQNGLLGTKYVEILPGSIEYPILPPGSPLSQNNKNSVSIDELLTTFKEIADNVNVFSSSIKNFVSSEENESNLKNILKNAEKAFSAIEKFASNTDNVITENKENLKDLIKNLSETVNSIKDKLPDTIDSIKDTMENASRKITDISESLSKAGNSISKAGDTIHEAVDPIKKISKKLENGEGVLGALITDDNLSKDIKNTVSGLKKYFSYADRLTVNIDTHMESMQGLGNDLDFKDAKGYFNFLIRPADDFAYIVGLTSSYAGVVKRTRTDKLWFDQEKHQMIPDFMSIPDWAKLQYAPVKEKYVRDYSAVTFNAQLAKEFGRLQCRIGIFENSFGVGMDYDIPMMNEAKWVSSLELYKFNEFMSQTLSGRVIFDIDMPNLKWYNRVFVNDSCYFVFGIDDFISKFNKNFFVGLGIDFEQNDLKYLSGKVV